MENRERDRLSQRKSPTEADRLHRETEERSGHDRSSADFGRKIGRAENLHEPSGRPKGNREE